jgi:sugar/nucleoside kinase (ribokinase family)
MSGRAQLDVLVAGDLFLDLVMSGFEAWPHPGEEAFAKKFHKEVGGGAAITACGLSKLGLHTAILGSVGKEDGQWMLDRLQVRGVDTSRIRLTSSEPTAFTVSVSTAVDRTFLTYGGANRELPGILRDLAGIATTSQVRHIHLAHAMDLETVQPSFKAIASRQLLTAGEVFLWMWGGMSNGSRTHVRLLRSLRLTSCFPMSARVL